MVMKHRFAFALLASLACAQAVEAQYPNRPIRLIAAQSAGSSLDTIIRIVMPRASEILGQPIVVDNRAGASTVIGAEIAARAPADGHTLFTATVSTLVVVPLTRSKLPFDAERDFAPVSMIAAQPYLMATHPLLPATTL